MSKVRPTFFSLKALTFFARSGQICPTGNNAFKLNPISLRRDAFSATVETELLLNAGATDKKLSTCEAARSICCDLDRFFTLIMNPFDSNLLNSC